jgi:hypothetical protein
MAVEIKREGWMQLFTQMRSPTGFLSRRFTVKPGGIYNGDKVAIDVQRFGEDVAVAIKKCTGPNLNDIDEFTTKEFTPPAYGEAFPLDVCELLNRMAGVDPFTAAYTEYAGQLVAKMAQGFMVIDDKIQRAVELQASQILQTGKLTLTNKTGDTVFELDFKPKAAHFPTVATAWSVPATCTPLDDIKALGDLIRSNGKVNPNRITFGDQAWSNFLNSDQVKAYLDNRRLEMGMVDPDMEDSGAVLQGRIWIGSYAYDLWTYPEEYKDPQTGNPIKYIADDKVVVDSTRTRFDMTSARVPLPLGPDPRVEGLLPGRLSSRSDSFDVTPNVYPTPNGKQIMGELESRPLLVPVQIDGFGCLDVEP